MKLRDILGVLRDSYCRTIGVEYMHIQDPAQRKWFQDNVEVKYQKPSHDEQLRVLDKLNQAEAFETFLQTKYVGQKRFSLEGGESLIPLLDEILQGAAGAGLDGAAIGMAHRGRLNVLTNIAGKTYSQIFREFEGSVAIGSKSGSGDVKYHLGTQGTFVSDAGEELPVYLAANPSHLETVDGVLEGIVRAKQDRKPIGTFSWLPILVHGDAAFAGQGVVVETLQMSQLRGYRTGGTVHVVVNNQVGFTTLPQDGRTSVYATDVAKTIQAPIFHVNGDDPEAVVRVAELAVAYRQEFNRDVVIDLVCYRRRGHNEGDDPSMTQPLMTNLIEAKRSVRRLYTEALVGRGDITEEEYDKAKADFQNRLEIAFAETHAAETGATGIVSPPSGRRRAGRRRARDHRRPVEVVHQIGDAFVNKPEGFTVHQAAAAARQAPRHEPQRQIDWGFGELLAFGSLLMEGTNVRLAGQDARRGTFVQRHAVLHDRANGQEWLPLANLSDNQGRFYVYDSLLSEYAAMAFEYGYSVERPDTLTCGRRSSATSRTARSRSSTSTSPRPTRSGASSRASCCCCRTATRARAGPLLRAHRALPAAVRAGQHDGRAAVDAGVVLPPAAPPGLRPSAPPADRVHPEGDAAPARRDEPVEDFTTGRFEPVLDDARAIDKSAVKRVLLHSGKIHWDLVAELEKKPNPEIASCVSSSSTRRRSTSSTP
jgi:2-oxoglutarate dehydrogenase E1 component